MSGSTSKGQRREFRKIVGDQAAELLEQQRDVVANLKRENEALAREFVLQRSYVTTEIQKLHGRCDGASKWGEKNEGAVGQERTHRLKLADEQRAYVDRADRDVLRRVWALEERFDRFTHATFRERLRWALFGLMPRPADHANQKVSIPIDPMPWGDGV